MAIALTPETHKKRINQLIGLSPEDVAERRSYIGGSDANTICSNNAERIHKLWMEKSGLAEPEDLSDILAVQMGTWTEDLNLYWFEKQTGLRITERNVQKPHKAYPFIRARADGEIEELDAVLDAKHVSAFNFDPDVLKDRYSPQLAVQMACTGRSKAILSVFSGSNRWERIDLDLSQDYVDDTIDLCQKFWASVLDGREPHLPKAPAPVERDKMRTVDMSASNSWRMAEVTYLETLDAVYENKSAASELKELVEHDVKKAVGRDLQIKRDTRGALRISKVRK